MLYLPHGCFCGQKVFEKILISVFAHCKCVQYLYRGVLRVLPSICHEFFQENSLRLKFFIIYARKCCNGCLIEFQVRIFIALASMYFLHVNHFVDKRILNLCKWHNQYLCHKKYNLITNDILAKTMRVSLRDKVCELWLLKFQR